LPAYYKQNHPQLHGTQCQLYIPLAAYFALQQPIGSLKDEGFITMPMIAALWPGGRDHGPPFPGEIWQRPDVPITGVHDACGPRTATPAGGLHTCRDT